jgi:Cd2+/Zn2+-exporting ATPase
MQVTSLLSRHEHEHADDASCSVCGADHEHAPVRLWQTLVGVVFVLNAFIVDWLFTQSHTVASASALIGAVTLGYPIIWTAIQDISMLSINELVAIAVLAAFASGDYKTAGVVAFFMLMGQIIETRTAEGARASIESLIKLTPTKARRVTPTGRGGSGNQVAGHRRRHPRSPRRQRGGRRRHPERPGVLQPGHHHRRIAAGGQEAGDEVFAGTQNLTGALEIKVSRAGQDTTLGKVRELILAAEKTKLPIMRIVDQYMGFYTPLVLVIGALVWAFTGDLSRVITVSSLSVARAPSFWRRPAPWWPLSQRRPALGILIKNVGDIDWPLRGSTPSSSTRPAL